MKIAIGSDMANHLTEVVVEELVQQGHQVEKFGALVESSAMWPKVAIEVAEKVASGEFEQALLFCWTGTGIAMAANKVPGIRAALCTDAQTAEGARLWNDANVLAMSLRSTSEAVAKEILKAWFETGVSTDKEDLACLMFLREWEESQTANQGLPE